MLLALPPNQKGYLMALCFFLSSLLLALTAAISVASAWLMMGVVAPVVAALGLLPGIE